MANEADFCFKNTGSFGGAFRIMLEMTLWSLGSSE
jgi:hypothetical protein